MSKFDGVDICGHGVLYNSIASYGMGSRDNQVVLSLKSGADETITFEDEKAARRFLYHLQATLKFESFIDSICEICVAGPWPDDCKVETESGIRCRAYGERPGFKEKTEGD